MNASREARTSAQIANPLVQASLLGEAVDAADLAILISDEDGRCIAVNQQACALLGYERDDLLDLTVSDFVPDTDPGAVSARCTRAVAGGRGRDAAKRRQPLAVRYWSTPTEWRRCASSLSARAARRAHLPRDLGTIGTLRTMRRPP